MRPESNTTPTTRAVGTIGAIGTALTFAAQYSKNVKEILDRLPLPAAVTTWLPYLFLLVSVAAAVVYLREHFDETSFISNNEAVDQPVTDAKFLYGRTNGAQTLAKLVVSAPVTHVTGEAGVGKSAFLRFGLVPKLGERGDLRVIYVDSLGRGDWEAAPEAALARAVWRDLLAEERKTLDVIPRIPPERTSEVLEALRNRGLIPVLVIDDFETYMLDNEVLLIADGSWRSWESLTDANRFWRGIARLLDADAIHLLLSTNAADAAGLASFRVRGTAQFRVERPSRGVVSQRLDEITTAGFAANPEAGWNNLRKQLIQDLTAEGEVLPVRLTWVLQGLTACSRLTLGEYRRIGGLSGIEAEHVLQRCKAGANALGGEPETLLSILSALRSAGGDSPPWLTASAVTERAGVPDPAQATQTAKALQYLEERQLVRSKVDAATGEPSWSLYHPFLARAIADAEYRRQPELVRLRESRELWSRSHGLFDKWRLLLSPARQVAIWWHHALGRISRHGCAPYELWSLLRWGPYVTAPIAFLLLADLGVNVPGANRVRMELDSRGVSIFRRQYTADEIQQGASSLVNELTGVLGARSSPAGWFNTDGRGEGPHDHWLHPQAISALSQASVRPSEAAPVLVRRLGLMFSGDVHKDDRDQPLGWESVQGNHYVRAEPIMWTALAAATMYSELKPSDQEREQLKRWMTTLAAMALHYHLESGAWKRFPQQRFETPSTYVTTLAIMMLLECKKANLPFDMPGFTDETLLLNAETWLMAHYDYQATPPGWKEYPTDPARPVGPALTLQVYSALSRSVTDMPPEFVDQLPKSLRIMLRSGFKERVISAIELAQRDSFRETPPDQPSIDANVDFLWYPWAVEAMHRGIVRAESLALKAYEAERVCQNLGELIVRIGPNEVQKAKDPNTYTFNVAEAAYALAPLARSTTDLAACRNRQTKD